MYSCFPLLALAGANQQKQGEAEYRLPLPLSAVLGNEKLLAELRALVGEIDARRAGGADALALHFGFE